MIDETSTNWTFAEDEGPTPDPEVAEEPAADDPWARQLEPGLLMAFLSDFRCADREKAAAEKATVSRRRDSAAPRFSPEPEPEPWESDPYHGSDTQVTPEWWFATDGRWYPPELHPDRQVSIEPVGEICEPIIEMNPSVEMTPSAESDARDRTARKSFFTRNQRHAGGFALEG